MYPLMHRHTGKEAALVSTFINYASIHTHMCVTEWLEFNHKKVLWSEGYHHLVASVVSVKFWCCGMYPTVCQLENPPNQIKNGQTGLKRTRPEQCADECSGGILVAPAVLCWWKNQQSCWVNEAPRQVKKNKMITSDRWSMRRLNTWLNRYIHNIYKLLVMRSKVRCRATWHSHLSWWSGPP